MSQNNNYQPIEFSTNIMDLKLDIGMMVQQLQNGQGDDLDIVIENLGKIQYALACILGGRSS